MEKTVKILEKMKAALLDVAMGAVEYLA